MLLSLSYNREIELKKDSVSALEHDYIAASANSRITFSGSG